MKSWYSASELMGLPGLPGSKQGVIDVATRNNWTHRPRAGRGGGKEYALKSLPQLTQDHLIQLAIAQVPTLPAPVAEPDRTPASADQLPETGNMVPASPATALTLATPAPGCTGDLKGWQRRRMEARLAILGELDRLADVLGGEKAVRALIAQAEQGQLAPELQRLVPVANGKPGKNGGRTLSRRTLYRWLADRKAGHLALAPKPTERQHIPAWAAPLLALYQRPTKPSLYWCMEELPKHLPEGVAAPSYWAALRFLKKLGNVEIERGRRGARDLRNLQPFRRRDTSRLWPGDIYTMDGHSFDAEIRHPQHGRPFRPEITTCLDVATRLAVGWSIALAESGWAVLDALRHACVSRGIPAILYVDNGSGYCNALMDDAATGLLSRLAITKWTSIPYNSQARGLIERSHQSLWIRAAKTLPTYMGDPMDKEARNKVYKLTRKDIRGQGASPLLMPWREFLTWAEAQVAAYNARPHRGLPKIRDEATGKVRHQSPNEAWAAAIAEGWEPVEVLPAEANDLFRPYRVGKTIRGEVSLFGNTYFSALLAEHTGDTVQIGYDIHDASRVWIRDRNHRLLCIAEFEANRSSYAPVTAIDEAAARRAKGRLSRLDRQIDEIEAEHAGLTSGRLPQAAPVTAEEDAAAAEMLARAQRWQAEEEAQAQADELAQQEATREALARMGGSCQSSVGSRQEDAPPPLAGGGRGEGEPAARPNFATDFDLWLWMDAHPEAATEQDRLYLNQALAESPALQIQIEAEQEQRARRRR